MIKKISWIIAIIALPNFVLASSISFNTAFSWDTLISNNGWDTAWGGYEGIYLDSPGLVRANEVGSSPSSNQSLGPKLTYSNFAQNGAGDSTTMTLRTGESGATFVYSDDEPGDDPGGFYENYVSIGDMDNYENDNFYIEFSTQNVFFSDFAVFENGNRSGESIRVRLWDGTEASISASDTDAEGNREYSNTEWWWDQYSISASGSGIKQIFFNEDNGGDDMGLIYVTAAVMTDATPSPVPVPAAAWLFGSALLGLGAIKRRKS
jgi:hypothetical protein